MVLWLQCHGLIERLFILGQLSISTIYIETEYGCDISEICCSVLDNISVCSLQFSSSCRLNDWDRCHDRLVDAEEYRYNRRWDATALVTKWQLGEQYIFVSTSFVFVHGWRSGLQAKTLVRIAQRVGSIQMGFCCIYYFSFYLLFFRVLTFLSYVFGNVYENGFCLISSICFQP